MHTPIRTWLRVIIVPYVMCSAAPVGEIHPIIVCAYPVGPRGPGDAEHLVPGLRSGGCGACDGGRCEEWWVLSRVSWAVPVLRGVCAVARGASRSARRFRPRRLFFFKLLSRIIVEL